MLRPACGVARRAGGGEEEEKKGRGRRPGPLRPFVLLRRAEGQMERRYENDSPTLICPSLCFFLLFLARVSPRYVKRAVVEGGEVRGCVRQKRERERSEAGLRQRKRWHEPGLVWSRRDEEGLETRTRMMALMGI